MKKILLSVLMFVSSIGMFAVNYTNKVTIAMSDGTYFPNLVIGESDDAGFAGGVLVNGYFGLVQDLASTPLSVYAYYQDEAYENLVLDDFTNVPMGIKTTNSTGYSLYFAGLTGSFTIYDTKEQVTIDCTETYHFTIDDAEKTASLTTALSSTTKTRMKDSEKYQATKYKVPNSSATACSISSVTARPIP